MRNININFQTNTIEISSTFAKNASNYGSNAYDELMKVKRDFPSYTVSIVKAASKKGNCFKGLTIAYMKKYITEKSGAESEQMNTFNAICGKTNDELAAKATYGEIKMWFLNEYPEIENARKNVEDIISKAKEARENRKAA